ncbi:unnamed protein product [Thlaspi arvense]|uniref:Peptidase C1A papain C-terminal domain-containing protein n=1 Tax=Thlaspi arvense TaxID=13288 RepID=A0AAU9R672_THLAR|nr:unnamed protein product [Thlaspi arvense]
MDANQSYKFGVNEFTNLIEEEFLATHTGLDGINEPSEVVDETMAPFWNWNVSNVIGKSKDWTKEGAVTPAKSQGGCGKSVVLKKRCKVKGGALIKRRMRRNIMVPRLVVVGRFQRLQRWKGFKMFHKTRSVRCSGRVDTACLGVHCCEGGQFHPLSKGSVQCARLWDLLDSCSDVSWVQTTKSGIKNWLAKNSWDEIWGENGYIRLGRDVEWPQGICGVVQFACYPVA